MLLFQSKKVDLVGQLVQLTLELPTKATAAKQDDIPPSQSLKVCISLISKALLSLQNIQRESIFVPHNEASRRP